MEAISRSCCAGVLPTPLPLPQAPYLNAIQINAQHLLRYLSVAVLINKRRRILLRELVRVVQVGCAPACRQDCMLAALQNVAV